MFNPLQPWPPQPDAGVLEVPVTASWSSSSFRLAHLSAMVGSRVAGPHPEQILVFEHVVADPAFDVVADA